MSSLSVIDTLAFPPRVLTSIMGLVPAVALAQTGIDLRIAIERQMEATVPGRPVPHDAVGIGFGIL